MRIPHLAVVIGAPLLLLGGCATLNEDQCRAGDWNGIGYTDGANGYTPGRFGDHVKACEKFGILPDQSLYLQGRERGLPVYCTLERGFLTGRRGNSYQGVCPAPLEPRFLSGYADGRVVWDAQQRIDRAESDINNAQSRWNDADSRLREEERRLADPATPDTVKPAIREALKRLRDDRRQADSDLSDARFRRDDAEREMNQLRYRFGPTYGTW
jgi:hypothetical protein